MKQSSFKVRSERGGWIRTTLAPINEKAGTTFGTKEFFMLMGIVGLVVTVARVCLAH
jgi:hypothetical protein